ncbi:MAG: glutaredoxin family protein [Deltaproteobacteria bacterium]|nr:MAG: glutaredoxin family protein [Deltaproteobacteria bacterium]
MVEPMGICEKHQLPLDPNGECELCRLSDMPSAPPPARSAWWALIIPLALALAGVAWAFSSFGSEPQGEPQRGVRTTAPRPAGSTPAREQRRGPEPAAIPKPPRPPIPGDIPIPEPSPKGTQLQGAPPPPGAPMEADVSEWKWDLARRRVSITMYATQWCGVCRKAREYMKENRIDFTERDTEESSAANERLGELNPRKTIPTFEIDELVYIGFQEQLFEAKLNQAARKHL